VNCTRCGVEIPLDTASERLGFQIIGWEQEREAGGTNHVLERRRTGKVICPSCLTNMKAHVSAGQMSIS